MSDNYEKVKDHAGKTLFEVDARRVLVRTVRRGKETVIDFTNHGWVYVE